MPRSPDVWRLGERLAVSLPVETGEELSAVLNADIDTLRAYTADLDSSVSAAENRRIREKAREELIG